ncbi:MAG: hypothetical protein AAB373_03980 [Patescibacteria group bacterium]
MKKICLVLSLFLVLTACSSNQTVEVVEDVGDVENVENQNEVESVDVEELESKDITNEREEFLVEADSVLVDDTKIGFNYEPAMVADQDFSTSWCTANGGARGELVVTFQEFVKAENVGIMPGFGRDDVIYFQNNRIKELEISFATNGDFGEPKIVEFSDDYKMHFIDLDGQEFHQVKFVIKDVYKGSKYGDTCIAEVDFWSDFVGDEDAKAAMDYYVKNKKDFALSPYDIISKVVMSNNPADKCNNPGKRDGWKDEGDIAMTEDGTYIFYNGDIYASGYVNEYGKEGDLLTVKWYQELLDFENAGDDGFRHVGWDLKGTEEATVVKSCDGKLYVHSGRAMVTGPGLSRSKVAFYHEGKIVGGAEFGLTQ